MGVSTPPACSLPHAAAAEGATPHLEKTLHLALSFLLPLPSSLMPCHLVISVYNPWRWARAGIPCSHFTDGEPTPKSGKVRARESYFMQAERKQPEGLLHEETLQRRLCEGWGPGRVQGRPRVPQPQDQHLPRALLEGRTGTQAAYRPQGLEECLVISPRFYRVRETEAGERGGVGGPAGGGGGEEEAEERACGAPSAHEPLWPR